MVPPMSLDRGFRSRALGRVCCVLAWGSVSSGCGPTAGAVDGETSAGTSAAEESASSTLSSASESSATTEAEPCSEIWDGNLVICDDDCVGDAIPSSSVQQLQNVGVVTGRITVIRSDLIDLQALSCLRSAGAILVSDNENLASLAGLEGVVELPGTDDSSGISIRANPALESLAGLDSLHEISGIELEENNALARLDLNHVETLGSLYLGTCAMSTSRESRAEGDNPSLTALDGFDALQSLGKLSVSGQSGLVSLERLRELAERGVELGDADFHLNQNLDISEIDAFMAAAGITGTVCGNQGDDAVCMCPPVD
jgi:hypothetical protein